MSAGSVTAYLSPTMARNRAISSGGSGGVEGLAIFIPVTLRLSFPPHRGSAQPVVDGFAEPVIRDRHHGDGARAFAVEGAKITEKMGGGLIDIAPRRQIHDRRGSLHSGHRGGAERQQRLAGLNAV